MNKPLGKRWTIARLLQFEQYQSQDEHSDAQSITTRDRALFQSLDEKQRTRPRAYLAWLHERIPAQPLAPDTGLLFVRSYQGASWLMIVVGLLMGAMVCFGALNYDQAMPVNVAIFLALIVLPQLLMLGLLVFSVVLSLLGGSWFSAWYRPAASIGQRLMNLFWRQDSIKNGAESSDDAVLKGEVLKQCFGLHSGIFANRTLRLFQVLGIAFNCGVILSLLLLLAITDRAFGWQSSLTESPEVVAQIVTSLAWPWREIWGAGIGFPTLEQIQSSRILLNSAGVDYQSMALKAWWPFLLLCVVFYGLLPRVLVYLFALVREPWLLSRLGFDSFHYQELWRRMQSIDLRSSGQPSTHSVEASETRTPMTQVSDGISCAYILQNSLERYQEQYLISWLPKSTAQCDLIEVESLAAISTEQQESAYVVIEGWQPPIEEVLLAVVDLAKRLASDKLDLHLLLLGKPSKAGSKPVTPRQADVWRKKLDIYQQANIIVHASVSDA